MRRTPDEALRYAVDALGGDKAVGYMLWAEISPILSGQRVAHCLDPERREKFSLEQTVLILQRAKAKGDHRAMNLLAELCGYRVTAVIDQHEELADLAHKAAAAAQEANTLSAEVIARMRAANIRYEP